MIDKSINSSKDSVEKSGDNLEISLHFRKNHFCYITAASVSNNTKFVDKIVSQSFPEIIEMFEMNVVDSQINKVFRINRKSDLFK